jgi:Fur family iron response transcriptional regulator
MATQKTLSMDTASLRRHLHGSRILPTRQRMEIASVLLARPQHLSADQILETLQAAGSAVSKATVYNTLNLFAKHGLVRTINVEGERTLYDSNTENHAHFYNLDSGEITDIDAIRVHDLPLPPEGTVVEEIDLVIRVRNRKES